MGLGLNYEIANDHIKIIDIDEADLDRILSDVNTIHYLMTHNKCDRMALEFFEYLCDIASRFGKYLEATKIIFHYCLNIHGADISEYIEYFCEHPENHCLELFDYFVKYGLIKSDSDYEKYIRIARKCINDSIMSILLVLPFKMNNPSNIFGACFKYRMFESSKLMLKYGIYVPTYNDFNNYFQQILSRDFVFNMVDYKKTKYTSLKIILDYLTSEKSIVTTEEIGLLFEQLCTKSTDPKLIKYFTKKINVMQYKHLVPDKFVNNDVEQFVKKIFE
jgi:hypothetical protein